MSKYMKRDDGRYMTSITIGKEVNSNKRIRQYFYGDTCKEIDAQIKEFNDKRAAGLLISKSPVTVSQWADKWLRVYGQGSYTTQRTNDSAIAKLKDYFGDAPLEAVRKSDIRSFAQSVAEYSFSMVQKIHSVVNRVFRDAIDERLIQFDPCRGVKWEYGSKGTHRALEEWEIDLIRDTWAVHRAAQWAMIMLYAGLRRGELLALTWDDVDFKANVIHVSRAVHFEGNDPVLGDTPKTLNGVRDIPILAPLREMLFQMPRKPGERVALSAAGEPLTETAFRRAWETFQRALTNLQTDKDKAVRPGQRNDLHPVPEDQQIVIRPHDLRHTFCTLLYNAGVDIKTAQYLMGHSDAHMIMEIYAHLSERKKAESVAALDEYVAKQAKEESKDAK